jgi:hypothetical protein
VPKALSLKARPTNESGKNKQMKNVENELLKLGKKMEVKKNSR